MYKREDCLIVDEDDLEQKTWTCSKYLSSLNLLPTQSCKAQFESSIKFRVHIRKHHLNNNFPSKFMCPVQDCKESAKVFTRIQNLQNHYDCIHRKSQEFVCSICKRKFSSSKSCSRHVKDCSSGMLNCNWCSRTFCSHSSLSRHSREKHYLEFKRSASKRCDTQANECQTDCQISGATFILVPISAASITALPQSDHGDSSNSSKLTNDNPVPYQTIRPHTNEQMCSSKETYIEPAPKRCKEHNLVATQKPYVNRTRQSQQVSSHDSHVWGEPDAHIWDDGTHHQAAGKELRRAWEGENRIETSYSELRRPQVGGFPDDLQDKHLFSALDNITTQTDDIWGLSEFSTQTYTEHNSFGTQTRCPGDEVLDSYLDGELVEYLDGEVQTDVHHKADSASLALQTNIAEENLSNDRGCGVDRLDRDCQTYYLKNSTHTQTKMRRERALVVVDGLNSHTQTASPETNPSLYNESFTQTMDGFS